MKCTAWWSIALVGLLATSCTGGDSSRKGVPVSTDVTNSGNKSAVTVSGDCSQLNSFFSELLTLTNQARQDAGVGALRFSYQLGQAAQNHTQAMGTQNFFSHTGKDNSTFVSRIAATGYQYTAVGENLAAGQTTPQSVVQSWLNSPSHKANLLAADFTEVGFGLYNATGSSDFGLYWAQGLGKPSGGPTRSEVYIPASCGITTASADATAKTLVAGVSARIGDSFEPSLLPGMAALSGAAGADSQSVPELAMLLGIVTLGLAFWRDLAKS